MEKSEVVADFKQRDRGSFVNYSFILVICDFYADVFCPALMDLFVILVVEDQAIILVVINADCVRGSESLQVFSTSIDGVSDSDCRNYFAAVRADLVLFIFLAKSEPDLVYY